MYLMEPTVFLLHYLKDINACSDFLLKDLNGGVND